MKVWIRIFAVVNNDRCCPRCEPEKAAVQYIYIYPTKEAADEQCNKHGGIVLEVEAAQLRGVSECKDNEVLISAYEAARDENANCDAWIEVCVGTLPHGWDEESGAATFPPETAQETVQWLDALEKETGFLMHQ